MTVSSPRLYMLQTGTNRCQLRNIKLNQGDSSPYEIPIPFYVLMHPKGVAVLDGGTALEASRDPHGYWGAAAQIYTPVMKEGEDCVSLVRALGIAPEDVRWVVQSHLHIDHTGSVGRFPNAVHIVQRSEYEYAYAPDWFAAAGYSRKDIDRPGIRWQFLNGVADDMYDIFGDGTLRTVFTPGHSPGHQSFMINLPNSGKIILAIDAAYTRDHWEERVLPGFMTSATEAVRSVQKLRAIAERDEAVVITGHDPDEWARFRKAPAYYD